MEPNIYNLSFGDLVGDGYKIDDQAVSENGDALLVLATVARAVMLFLMAHPSAQVYAERSTSGRTRLYQWSINKHFAELQGLLTIFGETEENWEPYEKGKIYTALLAAARFQ